MRTMKQSGHLGGGARPPSWPRHFEELPRALNRLDVVHAAAIPLRAEPAATRCGEMVEEIWHRVVGTVRGDEVVAGKCSAPITFAARYKDDLALFIREPIERLLDG
jgi:hypothetical protein